MQLNHWENSTLSRWKGWFPSNWIQNTDNGTEYEGWTRLKIIKMHHQILGLCHCRWDTPWGETCDLFWPRYLLVVEAHVAIQITILLAQADTEYNFTLKPNMHAPPPTMIFSCDSRPDHHQGYFYLGLQGNKQTETCKICLPKRQCQLAMKQFTPYTHSVWA